MSDCPGAYLLCIGIVVHLYIQSMNRQDHDRDILTKIDRIYQDTIAYVESRIKDT
jgi:hypothetical protein